MGIKKFKNNIMSTENFTTNNDLLKEIKSLKNMILKLETEVINIKKGLNIK